MTKNKILKMAIEEVKYMYSLKQAEIAEKLGVKSTYLSDMINGRVPISENISDKLYELFHIKIDGTPKVDGEATKDNIPIAPDYRQGIPYYDIDVTASITESFNDSPEMAQYYINYAPLNDCTAAFPVFGDSMLPDFCPGEVVLVKEITNVDSMLWGEPYLVITGAVCDNLRTIKNVYLSSDRKSFILRATNPRFQGDTIVARDNVIKIFLIKGKLNRRQL